MTTIEKVKQEIRDKRSEAHNKMEHTAEEEDTRAAGKFSAYTNAINLVERIDEVRLDLE